MKIEDVKKLMPLERLLYWITERESIRLKKEAGQPRPWTDDRILDTYRFCSVRRMDDRVSQWIWDNWYEPNYNDSNMLVAATLARFFNFPATLAAIGYPEVWDKEKVRLIVKQRRAAGKQIFNGAYLVSTNGIARDKIDHVIDFCVDPLSKQPMETWIDRKSIQRSCENLQKLYGLAEFMSGQIVADLRWALDGSWADKCSWAAIGPGSRRGMNRLLGRKLEYHLKQFQLVIELRELHEKLVKWLPTTISSRLEAIDEQSCLCELDKYERTLWEGRRPKSLYTPYTGA